MSFSFGFTGSFMLVLCTICIVQCLNDRSRDKRNANIQKAFEDYETRNKRELEKRAIGAAAAAEILMILGRIVHEDEKECHVKNTTLGLAALRKVLVGAKMVSTKSINYRKYKKPGTADTALADFYSVQPRNIKEYRRRFEYGTRQDLGRVIQGHVGDRRIALRLGGDNFSKGRPVLEVVDYRKTSGRYIDRIVYYTD